MLYNAAMEFDGFKLRKTEFKFETKKKYDEYFSNALIDSPLHFIRISKAEFDEKMHITLSWMMVFKMAAWIFLGITVIGLLAQLGVAFGYIAIGLSFLNMIGSSIAKGKLENLALGKSFCIQIYEMDNYENLEIVRQELIEEKKKSNETPE